VSDIEKRASDIETHTLTRHRQESVGHRQESDTDRERETHTHDMFVYYVDKREADIRDIDRSGFLALMEAKNVSPI